MKIKVFEPPLPDFDQMSYGGEVEPRKMQRGGEPVIGFVPDSTRFTPSQVQTQTQVRNSVQQNLANIPTGNATRAELRELAEEIFREQQMAGGEGGRRDPSPVRDRELRAQEIESILDRLLENSGIVTGKLQLTLVTLL